MILLMISDYSRTLLVCTEVLQNKCQSHLDMLDIHNVRPICLFVTIDLCHFFFFDQRFYIKLLFPSWYRPHTQTTNMIKLFIYIIITVRISLHFSGSLLFFYRFNTIVRNVVLTIFSFYYARLLYFRLSFINDNK